MSKTEYYKQVKEIDAILTSDIRSSTKVELFIIIENNKPLEDYFFSKVKDLIWFDKLSELGYFNPENAPGPRSADQEGFYTIPGWNVLTYLEQVSEQLDIPGNEKYIDELLNIMRDVSRYRDANGNHIDNYHTWRSFVLILLNIPKDKISLDIIDLIPVWLDSRFDTSLVGSEVGLKLLPKFLDSDPSQEDITKGERIVDFITNVKSVKLSEERARIYNREEEYNLVVDAYWIKKVFDNYAKDIGEKYTNNVIYALSDKIRTLLKRHVSLIPFEAGDKAYLLALSSEKGKYSVRVFDMGEKSEISAYEYVFMTKKLEGSPIKEITMEETTLDMFSSHIFDELTKNTPFDSVDKKAMKRDIYRLYSNFYDSETYASFYDESKTHSTGALEVLTFALKSILQAKAGKHIDKTKEVLTRFFEDNYLYFPKMALYLIGNNISKYNDDFFTALEKDMNNLIFGEIYFGDELRHVLESLSGLSPFQKEKIFEKIEQGPGYIPKEDVDIYIAKWKQERCHALIRFPEFKEKYELLKTKTGIDVGLHPAMGEIKTRRGWGKAGIRKEDILQILSVNGLPQYLKDFKPASFWEDGPTVGGLAKLIKECTTEHPDKFIDKLTQLDGTGFIYVYETLDGIKDAWTNKKDIAWGNLLEFIYQYIDRHEFWEDKLIVQKDDFLGGANHFWIIGAVTDLIREGARDDNRPFDEIYLKKAEQILFLIFDNLEAERKEEISDYVTHALNSPHGKTLSAFINLALRIARVNDKKGDKADVKWSKEIKGKYDELIEKKIIESYTYLGRYLPNLYYLDKAWSEGKVKGLYPVSADRYWEAFMDGYLSIGTVYIDLYELMTPHYEFGISYDFKEKRDNEHLVQHIVLGYLLEFEKKKLEDTDGLIREVLDNWKPSQIMDLVSFLLSQQRYLEEQSEEGRNIVEKIILLWKWMYINKYKDKPLAVITENDKQILSKLGRLTVFLPQLDEEFSQWILLSVPYITTHGSSFFIESLNKFGDKASIGYAGKIFQKMLEHYIPTFDEEHIRSLVEKLYIYNYKDAADSICNVYGMNGFDFLRELWEQHNP